MNLSLNKGTIIKRYNLPLLFVISIIAPLLLSSFALNASSETSAPQLVSNVKKTYINTLPGRTILRTDTNAPATVAEKFVRGDISGPDGKPDGKINFDDYRA